MGKGKCVAGIALDDGSLARVGGGQARGDAVESQVYPGGQEAEPRQEKGSVGAEQRAGQGVEQDKQGGEVLDADAKGAFEQGDGMLGDQLLEGDEKGSFEGQGAVNDRVCAHGVGGQGRPQTVDDKAHEVGDDGDEENELGKLGRAPGALEIAAGVEEGEDRGDEAEDVLLNQSSGEDSPRVVQRESGDDGQERDVDGGPWGLHRGAPLAIAKRGVEEGEAEEGKEEGASQGREVDAERHLGHGSMYQYCIALVLCCMALYSTMQYC